MSDELDWAKQLIDKLSDDARYAHRILIAEKEKELSELRTLIKIALGDLTIAINSSWKENRQEQWMNYLVNAKGVLESTTSPKSEVEP